MTKTMATDPLALATRIEREGLTAELCEAAALVFGWVQKTLTHIPFQVWHHPQVSPHSYHSGPPPYRTSLDAVRAEMPEGWEISIFEQLTRYWRCVLIRMSSAKDWTISEARASTMQAAWLAAILRAVAVERNTKEPTQ